MREVQYPELDKNMMLRKSAPVEEPVEIQLIRKTMSHINEYLDDMQGRGDQKCLDTARIKVKQAEYWMCRALKKK